MSTRIRYVYTQEPLILISKQFFLHPTDGSRYKVKLNEGEKTFEIIEDLTGAVVSQGSGVNFHQTKINAKAALTALGITFAEEARKTNEVTTNN